MGKSVKERFGNCSGRSWLKVVIPVLIVAAAAAWFFTQRSGDEVDFTVLDESEIPQEITSQVIPEYRTLERALACKIGEAIYVLATRGEKTSEGYDIDISKMIMESEDGETTLVVYADFRDPQSGVSLTQILNYPLQVAKTELEELPDNIQLKVRYED